MCCQEVFLGRFFTGEAHTEGVGRTMRQGSERRGGDFPLRFLKRKERDFVSIEKLSGVLARETGPVKVFDFSGDLW